MWILNFHGVPLAILWTSGRTSILAALFAVCAAGAFTADRPVACGVFTLLALLSKEEPLLLPGVFLLWLVIDGKFTSKSLDRRRKWSVAASAVAAALYLVLRWKSGAFTPFNAPDFYRYQLSAIPMNAVQYADRSLTLPISLLLIGAVFVRRGRLRLTGQEHATILKGLVWLVGGFALTIMIPVRSSLYVCLPAVGSALILAAVASAEWRAIERRRLVLATLLLMPLAFVPIHWARNAQLSREQRLGANVLRVVTARLGDRQIRRVVVYDDRSRRPSIGDAFGDALPVALKLVDPRDAPSEIVVSVEPPSVAPSLDSAEFVLSGTTIIERSRP